MEKKNIHKYNVLGISSYEYNSQTLVVESVK